MVTENDRRWPVGLHGTPKRFGKLLDYESFDQAFFSVHGKQAQVRCGIMQCPFSSNDYCVLGGPVKQQSASDSL